MEFRRPAISPGFPGGARNPQTLNRKMKPRKPSTARDKRRPAAGAGPAPLARWRATAVRDGTGLRLEAVGSADSPLAACLIGTDAREEAGGGGDAITLPDRAAMRDRREGAVLAGKATLEHEFRVVWNQRLYWARETVDIRPKGPDTWDLEGRVSDVTASRETRGSRDREVQQILEAADCMLWRAYVFKKGDGIDPNWVTYIPPSSLYRKIFGSDPPEHPREFWNPRNAPDLAEMDARSSEALLRGASEYKQEFRILKDGKVLWMHEHVSVVSESPGEWALTGIVMDVTAIHEENEARRQKTEASIRQILARADCMIWQARVTALDGQYEGLKWDLHLPESELYRRLFRANPGDTPLLDWERLQVPEYERMRADARTALRAGAPGYEHEFHVPRGDELPIWLHEQVTIRPAGPGQWDLIGFTTDVSARKAAEEAHHKSETQLEHILTAADCLIWLALVRDDGAGDYNWEVFAPRSVLYNKLFGEEPVYTSNGRLILNWWKLRVPELPEMEACYKNAFRLGLPGYEHEFRAYVGQTTHWLREQVSIKPLDAGLYELVGVITDISARREAEMALAAEKERLDVTLRAMAEGVITTDTRGCIQFINPVAAALTGCDAPQAVGRPVSEICTVQDAMTGAPVGMSREPSAPFESVLDLPPQTQLVTRSGTRRTIEGCCAPIHSADARIVGTVFVFRDVTERERLEQELVRASRLESVGILAGGIAHDFNNILTAVMGNISIAKLEAASGTDLHKCLDEAERATLRARDLTLQLLTFAKGGEPVRSAVNLASIVREVSEFSLHGSLVKSVFDLPDDLWRADADEGQISRVVQNLVINATQAMPEGGFVRISARNETLAAPGRPPLEPGYYVHISIADTGAGIKPEVLPHIFDPYFTTKQTGSGLGLSASYSIVKKHRGLIDVESECGRGTTFHIWLPALRASRPASAAGEAPPRAGTLEGRVLFMDDEASIRQMAAILMRRLGLEVVMVTDGVEAVEQFGAAKAQGRPFSLVVMDLTVPGGMGGREALVRLREIDPGVRAVVSSGYSSDPVLSNYRDYGFCGVITKPYDVEKFSRVIVETLGRG
jgi:PAS domain S-box-containing protein